MANTPGTPEKDVALGVVTEHDENAENQPDGQAINLPASLSTTPYQVVFAFWIALSGWMVNFDLSYGGTVLQMESFRSTFGHCGIGVNPKTGVEGYMCTLSATAQSMVSLSSLFTALGAALSGLFGRYLGRRGTLQVGCLLIVIGAAGQCGTAGNYVAYNVCKCISCVGIGNLNAGSPLYGVEVTSSRKRGALVAIYSIGLACGSLVSACVCFGSSHIDNNWDWMTPIILQIPFAIIYALGLMAFPESPRWLLLNGKEEAARRSFAKYFNRDPQSDVITAQLREVETYIEFEKSLSSTNSWTELFHRSYIRRTMISFMVAILSPFSGITLVGNYAAVFFSANGVSEPFLIQVYLGVCGLIGSLCGPGIVEYGGRRFASLFGFGCMSICMLVFSAVASGVGAGTETARNVLVAFLCMWFFFFASCISSSHWLIGAEVHSVRLRTYGQASSVMVANICNFAAAFWTPYMINPTAGNMGTNVGYFYFGLDVIGFTLLLFFLPETARLSLEQIDDYFASGRKAWKTSINRNKMIAKGETSDMAPETHEAARRTAWAAHDHADK